MGISKIVSLKLKYKNIEELKEDLNKFLIYYSTKRRHSRLTREFKVRTPCKAV